MSQLKDITPPRLPLRLLRFFVKEDYLEEIEGDMEEVFYDNLQRYTPAKSKRIYWIEMFKLLRPNLLRNTSFLQPLNQYPMFKNYFKVSIRGLMKNPLTSSINLVGLSIAIGFSIFVYAFANWTYSTDQFHEHKNNVYLTTFFANRDGQEQQYGTTPRPLGELLRNDFAQIKKVCRLEDHHAIVKRDDHVFHENIRFTDPEFLEMFTFPLKWGISSTLKDVNSIILSEDMALKYFGDENPVGQVMLLKFDNNVSKEFKVGGVASAFPKSLTIHFNFLINFDNLLSTETAYDLHDWRAMVNATFIQIEDPQHVHVLRQQMDKYKKIQNKAVEEDWAISSFSFEPLATLHEQSEYIREDISRSSKSNYSSVVYMMVIGAFMLALACFNFINIAIVSAAKRLKEIGVRKSIGANRRAVIIQFLSENVVMTFFALFFGLVFAYTFFIPGFEYLWDFNMNFSFADKNLWIYLPAILFFTAIASGAYPAFYISKFQAVGILKGSVRFGQKNMLTKVFLALQLILACVFMTGAVMFTQNSRYMAQRGWGYDQFQTMYAQVPDEAAFEQLQAKMSENPDVVSISGSVHHLGKNHEPRLLHFADRDYEANQLEVDARYFETMGLTLQEGRGFKDFEGSDKQAVVVNAFFVKNMGLTQAIGQQFRLDSVQYEIVGVLADFHSYSFQKEIQPTFFTVADKKDYHFLTLKVNDHAEQKVYSALQSSWAQLFPEIPFEGGYQEDVWGNYYTEIGIHGMVWRVIAILAITLASLGLYGLVKLNVTGRLKEFSIRKVLGAELKNIAVVIYRQYALLFVLALLIGAPISYTLIKLIFDTSYEYHMPVDFSGTTIAVLILVAILLVTISTQIRSVVRRQAIEGLKND
ncbi:MAG: ABC transporter permease [Cytophagia bacterium]|nr:ABC transporter permease [Cytophagia bacterium]